MILYKYTPERSGCEIVTGNSIGFAGPASFNDPFEISTGTTVGPGEEIPQPGFALTSLARRGRLMDTSAILSLSRSPLNPLMWAHYGEGYRGFAFGFEGSNELFSSTESNVVPAQFGNVIYSETVPGPHRMGKEGPLKLGREYSFRPEILEQLQRMFLYKKSCWSYEEEVRVVKCITGLGIEGGTIESGRFQVKPLENGHLYLTEIPPGALREVFLGERNRLRRGAGFDKFVNTLRKNHPEVKIYRASVDTSSWRMRREEL